MIVVCPECRARYRVAEEARGDARCARCDAVFVLRPAPGYRVRPLVAGARDLAIGMDDPALAPRLAETALDRANERRPGPALVYHVEAAAGKDGAARAPRARESVTWPEIVAAGLGACAGGLAGVLWLGHALWLAAGGALAGGVLAGVWSRRWATR